MNTYTEVTQNFEITAHPVYVPEKSSPEQNYYFFAYKIRIRNLGTVAARLVSRHWIITDGQGRIEEVKGPGVVGETPVIEPGEEYEYVSACPLSTPTGNMRGRYQMVDSQGRHFDVVVPLFFLRTEIFH